MMDYTLKVRSLVAINVLLAVAIALGVLFSPARTSARSLRATLLDSGAQATVLKIRTGGQALELYKSGDAWFLNDGGTALPADSTRVAAFLSTVGEVDQLGQVASSRSAWASLGLEGEGAIGFTVKDSTGLVLADIIVGDYTPSSQAVYVARAGSDDAWSAPVTFASYLKGSRASWLDRRLFPSSPAPQDVQEAIARGILELDSGERLNIDYRLIRNGAGWSTSGTGLDSLRVDSMIRSVLGLRGDEYAENGTAPAATALRVELRLGDGRSIVLELAPRSADGSYLVVSSERDRPLYLP
ncbi:MAG: DUF4340 domain-containing protein, partial [Spirochaetales bacterium]